MGVRVPLKRKVPAGSNPVHTAFHGLVYALVAQGTECWLPKPSVGGSNPSRRTTFYGLPRWTRSLNGHAAHDQASKPGVGSIPTRSTIFVFTPVAQWTRAQRYERWGRGFESLQACQFCC